MSAEEASWAATGARLSAPHMPPGLADLASDPSGACRLPWLSPVWDAGEKGRNFVPGFVRKHVAFWENVILEDHPLRDTLVSYLRDGVDVHDFLFDSHKGPSSDRPYNVDRFPGAVFANRIPLPFTEFVDMEMQSLIDRGCVVKWADVRSPTSPPRPRFVMALSVEETKPRLIYDARPLNKFCKQVPFSMDTVVRVANVASEGCYMTSLDDLSAFHHILLRPSSWPLFGFTHRGVDYCWCVLPFGFKESPWVYHTLSEAKAAFIRSKGIPALAYLDDSWLSNHVATQGLPARDQWLAAGEATHVAMLVSFMSGCFLSVKKCDLRPTRLQQYLGILCDSDTATFRVPPDKLDKLRQLVTTALDGEGTSFRTLQRIAGKCMSMTVAIRPASLWTHAMFSTLAALEKSGLSRIDLTSEARGDLVGELRQWKGLASTSHEGPWQRARHFMAALTEGASDASSVGWGGVVMSFGDPFKAGGVFPHDWLNKHINKNEMYAIYHLLRQVCTRRPEALRRAQVLIKVDNQSVVGAFNRDRAKDRETHALLVQLFDLQVEYGFMLSLKWVPTADNGVADAISRPSRDSIIRLTPEAFRALWDDLGPFNVDLMASTASAQRVPGNAGTLPFFSQFHCEGSSGADVLSQDVSRVQGTGESAFGYCFPPPGMAGHILQHMAECSAHAVIFVPDTKAYWFPQAKHATVRSRVVARRDQKGVFQWASQDGTLKKWRYPRWPMVAYEVDFRRG